MFPNDFKYLNELTQNRSLRSVISIILNTTHEQAVRIDQIYYQDSKRETTIDH